MNEIKRLLEFVDDVGDKVPILLFILCYVVGTATFLRYVANGCGG